MCEIWGERWEEKGDENSEMLAAASTSTGQYKLGMLCGRATRIVEDVLQGTTVQRGDGRLAWLGSSVSVDGAARVLGGTWARGGMRQTRLVRLSTRRWSDSDDDG